MFMSLAAARVRLLYLAANVLSRFRLYSAVAYAYDLLLRIQPDDPVARFYHAWNLMEVPGRRVDAIAGFQGLLPNHPSASGYYLLGCALQKESRHEEAVKAFRDSIRLEDSRSPDLSFNYAVSLEALGQLEGAVDAYRSAAQLAPSDGDAWWNLGALLAELGRRRDAVPCLERAMRLAPSTARALVLADTLHDLHRLDDAESFARDALARDARASEAVASLAAVLASKERYQDALAIARGACGASANAPSSRALLAVILAVAGSPDEALPLAREAALAEPDNGWIHSVLANVHLEMNDGAAALDALQRMANCLDAESNIRSRLAQARLMLGRGGALSLLGRHDEAESAFDEARRLDPEFLECWPDAVSPYRRSEAGRS